MPQGGVAALPPERRFKGRGLRIESCRLLTLLLLVAGMSGRLLGESLVPVGALWRYAQAQQPWPAGAPDWRIPGFDDGTWAEAPSGFSYGYGTYEDATLVPGMVTAPGALLLRCPFNWASAEPPTWLTLRVDYDDGFVAYLNGKEIARRNLAGEPGSAVAWNAAATNAHFRANTEEIDVTVARDLVVQGTNVLAIQAHKLPPGDMTFCLTAELVSDFTRGPFIQNLSSNACQVIWKTGKATTGEVEFGLDQPGQPTMRAVSPVPSGVHAVAMTGLQAGSAYRYRVLAEPQGARVASAWKTFRTFSASGPVEFLVIADTGQGSVRQYQIAEVMGRFPADLLLHSGDVLYPSFLPGYLDTRCFSVYRDLMASMPFFLAFGNHDLSLGDAVFLDAFYQPTNSVTGTEHFYSFDHGDVHFAVLYAPFFFQYRMRVDDAQYRWLSDDLARSAKPWKVLLLHLPILSSGPHGQDDYDTNGVKDPEDLMQLLMPLCVRHGVQLVLPSHDHAYERFVPTNGVHTIVSGGGGAALYPQVIQHPASSQFYLRHHFLHVRIEGDTLTSRAIDHTGSMFDRMSIQRRAPEVGMLPVSWMTSTLATNGVSDGDGNLTGQRFSWEGGGTLAKSGRSAHLGGVVLGHDSKHLRLGFRDVMIRPNQQVAVFLELPGMSGVSDLSGLTAGGAQAADNVPRGVALMRDLRFQGFKPALVLLLGDEWADSTQRTFRRPGIAVATGQGAFRLQPGLPDLDGAFVQQYNRSPQEGVVLGEQNADFIEVSLPLHQLGDLGPGGVIRLGAIVAGFSTTDESEGVRMDWDDGFAGASWEFGDGTGAVLKPWEARLAQPPDADGDGLNDAEELKRGTDPRKEDTDQDGLPDGWEVKHGLDPLRASGEDGRTGDVDGDGFPNWEEYVAGCDPQDAGSKLALETAWVLGGSLEVEWRTKPGRQYSVELARAARGPFAPLPGVEVVYLGETAKFVLPKPPGSPAQFVRVRVSW